MGRLAAQALLVCLVYYAGSQVGFRMQFPSVPTSIFWLPNATMFAVFLLAPLSRWWVYALAVLPAHVAVQVPNQMPATTIALLFVSNLADGALAVSGGASLFPRARTVRRVSAGRAVPLVRGARAFVVSFADAATMVLTGRSHDYWLILNTRFRSNVLTNIIWVPAVVTLATRAVLAEGRSPRMLPRPLLLATSLALVGFSLFGSFESHTVTAVLLLRFRFSSGPRCGSAPAA